MKLLVYLISYDLNKTGKDYEGIYTAIKDLSTGIWSHPLESVWLIQSNLFPANAIFKNLKPHLDSDDRCLVVEIRNNMQGLLPQDIWEQIRDDLFAGEPSY